MTISDLSAIGIHPNMGSAKLSSSFTKSSVVSPLMAEGCSGYVGIFLGGSGLVISSWGTKAAYSRPYLCTFSVYWNSMTHIFATVSDVCGTNGDFYGHYADNGGIYVYSSNGYACNTWVNIVGKPCEYVHS